jgi:hypothetical protein
MPILDTFISAQIPEEGKILIHRLKHSNGWVTEHNKNKAITHENFKRVIKKGPLQSTDFNLTNIPIPTCHLNNIGTLSPKMK